MRKSLTLLLCIGALTGCGIIPPPLWQSYDNYLYGPGTWVPNYYGGYYSGYGGGYYAGGYPAPYAYDTRTVVPNPAGPPPAAPPPPRKVRTVLVQRSYQNCSMDIYSDGVVSAVYNCSWANETPLVPAN